MKKIWVLLVVSLLFGSCDRLHIVKGSDNVVRVQADDEAMNEIIRNARESVRTFLAALENPKPNQRDFAVKFPFGTDPGSESEVEHIWLSNLHQVGGQYEGTVANDPYYIQGMKFGDVVPFDPSLISDWKYVEDDRLVGGRSIVFMIKNLSKEERSQVLREIDFKIDELSGDPAQP